MLSSPSLLTTFRALALTLLCCCALPAPTTAGELLPVDDAAKQPDFFIFRARLMQAVAQKDKEYLLSVLDPKIKISFGIEEGLDDFKKMWDLESPDSKLWNEMAKVLSLGGAFPEPNVFLAPYTFSSWPDSDDAFSTMAVIGKDVPVLASPSSDAEVKQRVSFAILPYAKDAQHTEEYAAFELPDGSVGYIHSSQVRSHLDLRAVFEKQDGSWIMKAFIAGD